MRRTVHGPPAKGQNTPPPRFVYQPPVDQSIKVLYQDEYLAFIDKPAGLLSVPGKHSDHQDSLETRLSSQGIRARLVHRLDMDTSGIMVLANSGTAHRHLGLQFERRQVHKKYIALVDGIPNAKSGTIEVPLRTDWPNRPKQMVDFCLGRAAVTRWQLIERDEHTSRLLLEPVTGRSHQLRVHLAELGHPILGDKFYGGNRIRNNEHRLMLHACSLELYHPEDGRRIKLESRCPF